ncbi:MAG: DUF3035 domain-containing protein [Alphaproteobacteria bacterium]|nr:DUF3035 domain-containing protein [Alphaproteobacteria bacterium]MCL2505858.1 DUF3035 domain-containing protein [Alphaproteobacteria bacterium]
MLSFSKVSFLLLCGFCVIGLTGCNSVRQDLGLGRNPPDEFAVIDRQPLSMPPDYTIRPPRTWADRSDAFSPEKNARSALFGSVLADADVSESERALIMSSGANAVQPNIRDIVNQESSQKVSASPHLARQLLSFVRDDEEELRLENATTVDPEIETARILAARENDEPINEGDTPVIYRSRGGFLGM